MSDRPHTPVLGRHTTSSTCNELPPPQPSQPFPSASAELLGPPAPGTVSSSMLSLHDAKRPSRQPTRHKFYCTQLPGAWSTPHTGQVTNWPEGFHSYSSNTGPVLLFKGPSPHQPSGLNTHEPPSLALQSTPLTAMSTMALSFVLFF